MPARLSAFVIWALVAASAVFWGLRLLVRAPAAPPHTVAAADAAPQSADLGRLFGVPAAPAAPAVAPPPAMASRFQLTGVVAPKRAGGPGIALIAVDGGMPRAYRVGAAIDEELVLQSIQHRSVAIGPADGEPAVVLEMPPLTEAATGTLPSVAPMAPARGAPARPAPAARAALPPAVPAAPAPPAAPVQSPATTTNMPGNFPSPEYAQPDASERLRSDTTR